MNGILYDLVLKPFEFLGLRAIRSHLLSQAKGKTLEIGVGTGLNLSHYPHEIDFTGVDPDPEMLKQLRKRVAPFSAHIIKADAESLPFSESTFDTVVATLVFCSIPHPEIALDEIYRVLKPGGHLLWLEHIRKRSAIGTLQDLATPIWKRVAGGCHLNRTPKDWVKLGNFEVVNDQYLWNGFGELLILRKIPSRFTATK